MKVPFPTWVDRRRLLKVAVVLSPIFGFLVADIIGWAIRRIPQERLGAASQTADRRWGTGLATGRRWTM